MPPLQCQWLWLFYCSTTTSLGMEYVEHKDSFPVCHTESLSVGNASYNTLLFDAMPMTALLFCSTDSTVHESTVCTDLVHRYTPFSINSCISLFAKSKNSNKASCAANPACVRGALYMHRKLLSCICHRRL